MNESQYTQSIHKQIHNDVYVWKINCNFAKGVPDAYYSGAIEDLWIELKYLQKLPKKAKVVPNLSSLQKKWLLRARKQGRNVAVIVGSPEGGFLLLDPVEWQEGFIPSDYKCFTKQELARWIEEVTCQGVWKDETKQSVFKTVNVG